MAIYSNHFADKLAGYAAKSFPLHAETSKHAHDIDYKAHGIRRRLSLVHKLVAEASSRAANEEEWGIVEPSGPHAEQPRTRHDAEDLNGYYVELIQQSQHKIFYKSASCWVCTRCWDRSDPKHKHSCSAFLKSSCIHSIPAFVHPSHQYSFQDPYHYCSRCGVHTNWQTGRTANLKQKCHTTEAGKRFLAEIAKGGLPYRRPASTPPHSHRQRHGEPLEAANFGAVAVNCMKNRVLPPPSIQPQYGQNASALQRPSCADTDEHRTEIVVNANRNYLMT